MLSFFILLCSVLLLILLPAAVKSVNSDELFPDFTKEFLDGPKIPPNTVDSIDLKAYLGRWYQMCASIGPNMTFEKDGYCITADYFKIPTKGVAFGLTNSQRLNYPSGQLQQASGVAFETKDPGKYVVTFQNSPSIGSYWIVALGEIPKGEKLYPWSMVSSPFSLSLYILARNPETFHNQYQDEVMKIVKEKGFTKEINKPLETYQGSDCAYPPEPRLLESLNLRG